MVSKPIHSITPFTLLDYPDKPACILWFAGCNMRCLYCYNPGIVQGKGRYGYEDAIQFLHKRKGLLDGVVLSGGECTMHKGLPEFCTKLKQEGLLVKLDTNGSNPDLILHLMQQKLIDYVALDYKAPLHKYEMITQSSLYAHFERTLRLLMNGEIPFEVRTTVHTSLLHEEDIQEMICFLEKEGYKGKLFIQHFINDTTTLGNLHPSRYSIDREKIAKSSCIELVVRN